MKTQSVGVIGAALLGFVLSTLRADESSNCNGPELSHARLLEAIKSYIKSKGYAAPRFENEKEWTFDFSEMGCDYIVNVSHLPYVPGSAVIYRISHSGNIIDMISGD